MNITIDAGNTHTKLGFFEDGKLLRTLVLSKSQPLEEIISPDTSLKMIVSSVAESKEEFRRQLSRFKKVIFLDYTTKVPLENLYGTPQTLGMDRLAAVAGAKVLYPGQPCLVIDAGTCITYDLLDEKGRYFGGSISPGAGIRFKALNAFTSRLPLLNFQDIPSAEEIPLVGNNTEQAIRSGVINGIVGELNSITETYRRMHSGLVTLICGGDANYFESKINRPIFALPDLVHLGLNSILEFNNEFES